MPHKVNPIDFENSEGNLGVANALLRHLADKLPVSRWQRDLTDSTVLRNLGVALGHALLGWTALRRGSQARGRPTRDRRRPRRQLGSARGADPDGDAPLRPAEPYEQLKALTRGKRGMTREALHAFVDGLALPDDAKARLKALTPATYLGLAEELAKRI